MYFGFQDGTLTQLSLPGGHLNKSFCVGFQEGTLGLILAPKQSLNKHFSSKEGTLGCVFLFLIPSGHLGMFLNNWVPFSSHHCLKVKMKNFQL